MNAIEKTAVAELFDRVPALAALRGAARISAEEAIRHAVNDAIDTALENLGGDPGRWIGQAPRNG